MHGRSRFIIALVAVAALVFTLSGGVFAAVPSGTTMSNDVTSEFTVESDAVGLDVANLATDAVTGMYDVFTVATVPTDFLGDLVRAKVTVTPSSGFSMEYLEQSPVLPGGGTNPAYGSYRALTFTDGVAWYGPTAGFGLQDNSAAPSVFRVTWNDPGTYTFQVQIVRVSDDAVLGSTSATVTVTGGTAMSMAWTTGEQPSGTYQADEQFTVGVDSDLDAASELDRTLFIIELQKNGAAASSNDFTLYDPSFTTANPQGIENTFEVEGDVLRGYWGPSTGFLFSAADQTTFGVEIHNPGTYNVKIYSIQLSPVGSPVMGANGMPQYWYDEMQ